MNENKPNCFDSFDKIIKGNEKLKKKAGYELIRHCNENGLNETKYVLQRLIRGLGSSNHILRCNFYAILVSLLDNIEVSIDEYMEIIQKELQRSSGNSKSENADIFMGQILANSALIRTKSSEKMSEDQLKQSFEMLQKAGNGRKYLQTTADAILLEICKKTKWKEFKKSILPTIENRLKQDVTDIDTLNFQLTIGELYPKITTIEIDENNLENYIKILMETTRNKALDKHPIFHIFTKNLPRHLVEKFIIILDKNLEKFNRNRLSIATLILTNLIENDNYNNLSKIFPNNYLEQMLDVFKQKTNDYLIDDIKNLFEKITKKSAQIPTRYDFLKLLLFPPNGNLHFEKITRTKLIQILIQSLKMNDLDDFQDKLREIIENIQGKWCRTDRIYSANLLTKTLNHPEIRGVPENRLKNLKFLAEKSLFANDQINNELADTLKTIFFNTINYKTKNLDELSMIHTELCEYIDSRLNSNWSLRKLQDDMMEIWGKTINIIKKIAGKSKKSKLSTVFQTLFSHMMLQLFVDVKLARNTLDELHACYQNIRKKSDENLEWIEVVVDLFLNLLSHNSHGLRDIIRSVFPHLLEYLTSDAFQQILQVLDPENETNPLSDDEDSENSENDDEDEDDDDDDDNDNEVKIDDNLRVALHNALNGDDGMDTDGASIDLDQLSDTEGEKLNKALGLAFNRYGNKKKMRENNKLLTHFRLRVLDLIDIYTLVEKQQKFDDLLEAIKVLLSLYEFSIRDDNELPLKQRVNSSLKRLTACKKSFDDASIDGAIGAFEDLLKRQHTCGSMIVRETNEQYVDCCVFLIRSIKNNTKISGKIAKILDKQWKKHEIHHLLYVLYKRLFSGVWPHITQLLPSVVNDVFDTSLRPFLRNQAIDLLRIFYGNRRFVDANTDGIVNECVENLVINTIKMLENDEKIGMKFVKNLLDLFDNIQTTKLMDKDTIKTAFNNLIQTLEQFCGKQNGTVTKDVKLVIQRLIKCQTILKKRHGDEQGNCPKKMKKK